MYNVANPGSALGEAIGSSMEKALNVFLDKISDLAGCHYITSGLRNTKVGNKQKKLLLFDNFGTEYNIDGVIANSSMQPLIIIESKYIRYKKHNRDKGSWLCTAHPAIRKHYHSIRSSIAVLAGNWSLTSQAMIKSYDINIFLISFDKICSSLNNYGIDFTWGEKEKEKAYTAWNRYNELTRNQKNLVGKSLIDTVSTDLQNLITNILDDTIEREIDKVTVELTSNIGEVKEFEFNSVNSAIDFLTNENLNEKFLTSDSLSLFDDLT